MENFVARSPSVTGLYCPSPSKMLFGVVTVVFLFFSALLLGAFTEDINDVNTRADLIRPWWDWNTVEKLHC